LETQTRLFDAADVSPRGSETLNGQPFSNSRSSLREDLSVNEGRVVVIRSSSNAIFGDQRSEFWIRNGLPAIEFADLVRESSGHAVLPLDLSDKEDALLLRHLSYALTAFVKLTERSGQRFTGKRINDVGKRIEYMIADELRKTPLEASVLGRPGYPDCLIKQGERDLPRDQDQRERPEAVESVLPQLLLYLGKEDRV